MIKHSVNFHTSPAKLFHSKILYIKILPIWGFVTAWVSVGTAITVGLMAANVSQSSMKTMKLSPW